MAATTTVSDRTATPQHVQVHTTTTQRYEGAATHPTHRYEGSVGRLGGGGGDNGGILSLFSSGKGGGGGPSATHTLAVVIGVPIGGMLLFLAGLSFVGSLIGLAVVTPLFILFSPVLVPAALTIGLAVAGILASDACGVMGLMSFSWMVNFIMQTQGGGGYTSVPEMAKHRVADAVEYVGQKTKDVGQKTKEVGQDIQSKAHEVKRAT
ncbi:hypothetical protein TanjilG_04133 [Lupinus angustifolius]|uniref:Oleosin n=1 Tax=Lupinus angustifolius TaxID=3871 RepID=A0A4P1RJ87_LUPAN|nr:PREDICTED: P24 oleosin-like [Lupinus angustifolius]OIW12384.1 hypothetical protein TanjilG_04133 [Lupinus angustifolius]